MTPTPALGSGAEQQALELIWTGSVTLAAISIAILGVLIFRRWNFARQNASSVARRAAFTEYFYAVLRTPIPLDGSSLPKLTSRDVPTIILIALDLLRTIQGQDAKRIVETVRLWNLFPHLRNILAHGRRGGRIQALTLLAHFDDPESLALLLTHASEIDPYVQLAALRGLAQRSAGDDAAPIIAGLAASNQTNALMLADILRQFGEPAIPALLTLAANNLASLVRSRSHPSWWMRLRAAAFMGKTNVPVRVAAIIALGHIGSPDSVDLLQGLLRDPEADIRGNAATALGNLADIRAAHALAEALGDSSPQVRTQAAAALGLIKSETTLPGLVKSLGDEAWWVRFRAAEALCRFGDTGVALLRSVSKGRDPAGIIATQILAEMVDG